MQSRNRSDSIVVNMTGQTNSAHPHIDQGVDLHAENSDGSTPVHCARRDGRTEVVKALLEKSAGVHAKCGRGSTLLH